MYERYEDGGEVTKISLSFCEAQAVRRVVQAREWRVADLDVINDTLFIGNYDSFKDVLLVLTAQCVVAKETFREADKYVLTHSIERVTDKIQEIWESEYE